MDLYLAAPGVRRRRRRRQAWCLVAVALVVVAGASAAELLAAHREATAARAVLEEAQAAIGRKQVNAAVAHLDVAAARLAETKKHARSFPLNLLSPIPLIGSPANALADGAQAGREVIAAGRIMAAAAKDLLPDIRDGNGHDLAPLHNGAAASRSAFAEAEQHLTRARILLRGPAGAALPPISRAARSFLRKLDDVDAKLVASERGMQLTSEITAPGADVRLLVLAQDSQELRSYGVIHVQNGGARLESFAEVGTVPPPNNVDWSPNFPTAAQSAGEMFRRSGGEQIDGVIGVTDGTLARLMNVFGSAQLQGFSEQTVDEIFRRVMSASSDRVPAVLDALGGSIGAGDLHLWFADHRWQDLLPDTVKGAS